MRRSFKLKFFLLLTCLIVFFAIVTRVSVRHASSKPIHELLYANFASYLELSLAGESALAQPQNLKLLEQQVLAFYSGLKPNEAQVWLSQESSDFQRKMLQGAVWRNIQSREVNLSFQLALVNLGEQQWAVFKSNRLASDLYVAIPEHVFETRFEDVMDARELIVNNMWPLLLLYIVLCTWFLTFLVMRSLRNLQNTFQKIEIKGNGTTLSKNQFDDEFASFIDYFNSLIKRLQLNYVQASRFSSDAAHELRTPLTVIRGNLKRLLNRAPDSSVEQIQLSMLSDEVERLISITNKLVLLSQADGNNFNLDLKPIRLFDLIAVVGEDIESLVSHVEFEYSLNPEIKILADPNLFQQLLSNLVSNAIKYTPPQGKIKFIAKVFGDVVEFSMANTTYLSLEGLDDRVFQRFYRHLSDPSTDTQRPKGDGLGLSLCQEITQAHGGTLTLHKAPDQWVTFKFTWQRAD
jgi:signal transduction histidine kinase